MLPIQLILAAVQSGGYFDLAASYAFAADEFTNGNTVNGDLLINADGTLDWTGDVGGTSQSDNWWTPTGGVKGTWHARLNQVSDPNSIFRVAGSDSLGTWIDVSSAPNWNFEKAPGGSGGESHTFTGTLLFSRDGGTTTYGSASVTMTLTEPSL